MNLLIAQRKTAKDLERRRGLATAQLFQELRSNLEFKVPTVADLDVDSGPAGGGPSTRGAGGGDNCERTVRRLDGSAATAAFSESHATAWLNRLKKETHGSARDTIIKALSADVAPKSARLMHQVPKHLDYLTPLQQEQVLEEVAAVAAPDTKDSYTELLTTVYLFQRNNLRLCENVLEAWYIATRQSHYERKRAAVGSALVWSDGARAGLLMEVRAMLLRARCLSWFAAPVRYPGLSQNDVRSTMPLMAPPELRGQTQEDFAQLRDGLRKRLSRMLADHQRLLEEKQRVVVERWMFKEKTKDLRKVQEADEEAKRQFEIAKKQVAEAPALLRLVEYMYTTHLAWSVEGAAVFLSQTVMDTTQLQIPVMAIAQFKPSKGKAGGRSAPKLASSPSYSQVQAHLNSLLQAAINSAMAVVQICEVPLTNSNMDDGDTVRRNPGCSRQAENLQLLIAASHSYRSSLLSIDAQLKQCFAGLDRSFGDVAQQLGSPQFLEYITLMSEFYLDRFGLAAHIHNAASAGDTGSAAASSSSAARPDIGPSSVPELTMAEFLAFWCTGPQLDFGSLQEELSAIFLCAAQSCARAEASAPLIFKELPPNVAATWSSQAAVAAKAWKSPPAATIAGTDTVCCTEYYDGVQVVMARSSNVAEVLARRLYALGQFREGTGIVPQDLELVQAMCTWFRALVAQCLRWQESARHLRPSYQFGPLRVDMSFFSFVTAQVPAAMLSMCTYMLNLYAVQNARFICRGIQTATDEVEAEDPRRTDVNREMRLRRVYAQIEEYKIGMGRLDAVLHALLAAAREPLLLDLTARLLGRPVPLDGSGSNPEDWQQKPEQPGVWHVGGALSVGALTLLLEVSGDTLAQLEVKTGNVVAAVGGLSAAAAAAVEAPARVGAAPSAAPRAPLEDGPAVAAAAEAEAAEAEHAAPAGPAFLTDAAPAASSAPSRSQSVDVRAAVEQQLAVLEEVTHLARLPEKQRLANVERFARCKMVIFRREAPSKEEEELQRLMPDSLARRRDVWEYTTCAICLTDFGDGEELSRAPCPGGHAFHPKCLRGWLDRSHTTCPVCRGGVGQDEDDDEAALAPTISSSSSKHVGPDALAEYVVRRMRSKKVDFTVSARNHRAAGQVLTQLREHRGLREEEEPQPAEDSAAGAAEPVEAKEAEQQSLLDRQPAYLEIFAARNEAQKVEAELRNVLSVRRGALRPGEVAPKRGA